MTIPAHRFTFILLIFLSIPSTSIAQTVNIPDPNLRAVIEEALGKRFGAPITPSDMASLTEFRAGNSNISDLTGLEHAINLTWLNLGGNTISDISSLSGLTNLRLLFLGGNTISDISSLSGLTNLVQLNLDDNTISDISSLSGLTNLRLLFLNYNTISDISALVTNTGLGSWDEVDLRGNPLSYQSIHIHIPALQSREVTVRFDDIVAGLPVNIPDSNLRAVIEGQLGKTSGDAITTSDMVTLTRLDARRSNISDLTGLEHAINLTQLLLGVNSISDISSLSGLTNLRRLSLGVNSISDISSLSGLTNLTRLSLWNNLISDISALVTNTGLGSRDEVDLRGNPLSSVSINTYIPTLQGRRVTVEFDDMEVVEVPDPNLRAVIRQRLGKRFGAPITPSDMALLISPDARNSNISDLTGLEHAINLTLLYLSGNSISDISSLSGLTNLTRLSLWNNLISDISSLSGLTNLTRLSLWNNLISDISALVTNTGLGNGDTVNVQVNPLSSVSIDTHIPALQSRGVTVDFDDIVAGVMVDLPDPNLRAAIEGALDEALGDPITTSDMVTLTEFYATNSNIVDLTGLEHTINLTRLSLWNNLISDISAVEGLTNLTSLYLGGNTISDISSLSGLTNLTSLYLGGNTISDISSLSGLTNLTRLSLWNNLISDISALVTNTGLGSRDEVDLRGNPLSYQSIHIHIPALQSRGVTVRFDDEAHPVLLKISGDNQKGASFAPLSQPYVVEVQDANGSALAGISVTFSVIEGGGTLSTTITRTDENGRAESMLTLGPNLGTNTVEVSATGIQGKAIFSAISDTESPPITVDVNSDGSVNILDLVVIASEFGSEKPNLAADVNGDGVINILDLILVAGMFEGAAAAPAAHPQAPEALTAAEVQGWLTDARALEVTDPIMKRGFMVLGQLLVSLTPRETELLPNYPNPFNPETWIPYRLAEDAFVTLTIYDLSGQVVRTLEIGYQIASAYESRSKTIYWDGRNRLGEQVASGVYFYHLSTGDYSATRKMLVMK